MMTSAIIDWKFSQVNFMKSHEILDQFDKSIKSYIEMFETLGLLSTTPPPPSYPGRVKAFSRVCILYFIRIRNDNGL